MTRAIALVLSAVAVALTGAVPADAAQPRKGPATCAKAVKRAAEPKRRTCRKAAKKRSATKRGVKAAPLTLRPSSPAGPSAPAGAAPAPDRAPAAAAPSTATPATPPGVGAPTPPTCDASPWLGTRAEDRDGAFWLDLTRTCVPAGRVLVQLVNRDLQPHNVYVEGLEPAVAPRVVVADVDGEATGTGEVDLAAGRWRFYCAIEGHEAMTGTVTATG